MFLHSGKQVILSYITVKIVITTKYLGRAAAYNHGHLFEDR